MDGEWEPLVQGLGVDETPRREDTDLEVARTYGSAARRASDSVRISTRHGLVQGNGGDEAPAKQSPLYVDEIVEEDMEHVMDFSTIDWAMFNEHDRDRSSKIMARNRKEPFLLRFAHNAYEASQGWIALTIIGFMAGALAAIVGIASDWAGDLRFGICAGRGWWLTRHLCCVDAGPQGCDAFLPWHTAIDAGDGDRRLVLSYVSYIVVSTLMAVTASFLVVRLAPYAAGSGISEMKVILGGFVIKRFLGALTLGVKAVGLVLSVGSGMALGKEGPFVHVAGCCANIVSRFFPKYRNNEAKKRELLSCSAAAGVAVAFGAPIGGVLFSLEEVSSYFPPKTMFRSFYCAMLAAAALQRLNPIGDKLVMFEVTYHHRWFLFEIVPFALLGVAGGVLGWLIIKLNASVCNFRQSSNLKKYPISEVAVVCAVSAAIDFPIIFLRGAQVGLLDVLFSDCDKITDKVGTTLCRGDFRWDVVLLLFGSAAIKLVLLVFTFGVKVPGGIFIPCLTIGALMGRGMGIAMQEIHEWVGDVGPFEVCGTQSSCIKPPIYAIVGGASVLGGATRMTVSLVVIMMEVTGGMQYIIPLMIGVIFAKMVGDWVGGTDTIYTTAIRRQGFPHLEQQIRLSEAAKQQTALDVATHRGGVTTLHTLRNEGETVGSIFKCLESTEVHGFPIVTAKGGAVGYVRRSTITKVLEDALVDLRVDKNTPVYFDPSWHVPPGEIAINMGRCMDKGATIVLASTPFETVIPIMRETGMRYLLVVTDGVLVGIIKKKDVLELVVYHENLMRKAEQETADGEG